jgi:hypothetical protein
MPSAAAIPAPDRFRPAALLLLFLGAGLALFIDRLLPDWPKIRPLPAEAASVTPIGESAWQPEAYGLKGLPSRYRRLATRGSMIDGDSFTGEHLTGWYRAAPQIMVLVAGGPTRPGNRLRAEIRHADGHIDSIPCPGPEPGEAWQAWKMELPASALAVRLHAIDGNTGFRGWLAFSEPFALHPAETVSWKMVAQILCTAALAVVLVLGPGLALAARAGRGPGLAVLWLGPSLLVAGGLLCWMLGGLTAPARLAAVWVAGTLGATGWLLWRHRAWRLWTAGETFLLCLLPLGVLGAAAKASFASGPAGELYFGLVSRSLEVGGHSDSRIPYHTVQLVAHHLAPHGAESQAYFSPWSFSSRGPLAGLAAAPVVLATGGQPPATMPEQAWEPFDRQGFATFRLTAAALNALGLVAVFGVLRLVADERRALAGAGLLALAPFFWHELYFSWPKPIAAAWVLGAFALVWQQRPLAGGLALGTAYLWHPLALLSAPFLALWSLRGGWRRGLTQGGIFLAGLLFVVALWLLLNHGHNTQGGFVRYALAADESPATVRTWLLSRWDNLANTLIPFYVLLVNSAHQSFGAHGFRSDLWVLYCHQAWTAAPFAVGLVAWFTLLPSFVLALWRHRTVAALCVVGPFLFIALYWGGASSGLMREAAHPVFLAGWAFLAWAGGVPAWSRRARGWFCAAAAAEALAMLFIPALVSPSRHRCPDYLLNDALWLGLATTALALVALIAFRLLSPPAAAPASLPRLG